MPTYVFVGLCLWFAAVAAGILLNVAKDLRKKP
jgi:hypothetical protein